MKLHWKILAGSVIAAVAIGAWAAADFREWDLKMHLPTGSVKDSQLFRVFHRRLSVSPQEFDLGGQRYRVRDAWLEHRAGPLRVSILHTRQEIFPELVLCVDLGPETTQADVRIKDAKRSHILVSAVNGVRLSEVGVACPTSLVLCSRDGRFEVELQVEERPNKAPEPTALRVTPPAGAGVAPRRAVAHL